ncbi:hypothetical protein [Flagellimonas sp.]|uniref:hypothetical protein n=1 Tax=Flagellimonas sp. TaxID=2058762 RepID=UPI003B5092B7
MMKLKFVSALSFAVFASFTLTGQQAKNFGAAVGSNNLQDFTSMQMRESLVNAIINNAQRPSNTIDLSNIEGSPYYTDNFKKGQLFYKNDLMGSFYLRYNAFQDQMEIKNSDLAEEQFQFLVQSNDIRTMVDGKEIQYFTFKATDGLQGNSYFTKEFTGDKYVLYSNMRKKYSPAKASTNSLAQSIPAKFIDDVSVFYGSKGEASLMAIPKKKKDFLEIFPYNNRPAIKKYIRDKRLRPSNLDHLKSIFIYAESL